MKKTESITEFYTRHGHDYQKSGQFNVYNREEFICDSTSLPPNRRDFYKISMIVKGSGVLSYTDKSIVINKPSITFFNPFIPYSWKPTSKNQTGFFCLFTEEFVNYNLKNESLLQSSLFRVGGNHIYFLSKESQKLLNEVFENMLREINSNYANKHDLLRSYVQIIMHEAMKMQPPETFYKNTNASERISNLFFELLERQFPIDSPNQVLKLKNANEFATQLNIHTNHLNRALKEVTGRATTNWIADRIVKETKALLQFSRWDIAEIAYTLGFEHSSNFITFFKKQTGKTPNQFRKEITSVS